MRSDVFKNFLNYILQGELDEETPLELSSNIATLTPSQWITLENTVRQENIYTWNLCNCNISSFSQEVWKNLFRVFQASKCHSLIISKDDTAHQLTETKWSFIFSEMKQSFITHLRFFMCNMHKIKLETLEVFLSNLFESNTQVLDFDGSDLTDVSEEYCSLFFQKMSTSKNLKSFILNGTFLASTEGKFWKIFIEALPQLPILHLELENTIRSLPSDIWISFCHALAKSFITSLTLTNSRFYRFDSEAWNKLFNGLNQTKISILNIEEYNSIKFKSDESCIFQNGLRSTHITTLIYKSQQFKPEETLVIQDILRENKNKLSLMIADNISEPANNMLDLYKMTTNKAPSETVQKIENGEINGLHQDVTAKKLKVNKNVVCSVSLFK